MTSPRVKRPGGRRYRRILRFATRYMVENWWFELVLPRLGLSGLAVRGRTKRWRRMARNFHRLATDLGGLMIKVGQFLSTRLDVLPREVTRELEGLQDEVNPEKFDAIRALAEAELGLKLEAAYATFEPIPMAAASLGQVHRATLTADAAADTGFTDVVVKVQRPGIEAIVGVDLSAIRRVARLLSRVKVISSRVDLPALAEEFATTSLEEIDYLHEAQNADRFAEQFAGDPRVRVPEIAWERTTRRVLTLEDVSAIKINDLDALRAAGIDPSKVATEFATVMFDQLFVHGFFHGDAHPGNIFVTPLPGGGHTLTFVDFGMMGEIPADLRLGLQQALIPLAARDGRRLVASMRDLGVLLPSADTRELEKIMNALFARFGGIAFTALREVDPREMLKFAEEFGETVRDLPFQLPENFLLVVRAASLTSGLSSTLDPDFNIWNAVEPYAAKLLLDEQGGVIGAFAREATSIAGILIGLPRRFDELANRVEAGDLEVDSPRLNERLRRIERLIARAVSAILFAGLLVGGIVLRPMDAVFGTVLMSVSVLPLLHAVFAGLFGRRRSN